MNHLIIIIIMGVLVLSPGLHAVTTLDPDRRGVTVDLEDSFAGTLVGTSGSNSYQIFEDLEDVVGTHTEIGFTLDVRNAGGSTTFASLYDTDRRLYEDSSGNVTRVYDDVVARRAGSEDAAAAGEDPDVEYNNGGAGWAGGNWSAIAAAQGRSDRIGNMILVQENLNSTEINQGHLHFAQGQDVGSSHAPDDLVGGQINFSFDSALSKFSFIWVDLENPNIVAVTFDGLDASSNVVSATILFSTLVDGGANDQDAVWGDRHANFIEFEAGVGALSSFDSITDANFDTGFNTGGGNSGGVGQIAYRLREEAVLVPEVSTVVPAGALVLFFLAGVLRKKWRKAT